MSTLEGLKRSLQVARLQREIRAAVGAIIEECTPEEPDWTSMEDGDEEEDPNEHLKGKPKKPKVKPPVPGSLVLRAEPLLEPSEPCDKFSNTEEGVLEQLRLGLLREIQIHTVLLRGDGVAAIRRGVKDKILPGRVVVLGMDRDAHHQIASLLEDNGYELDKEADLTTLNLKGRL